MRCNSNRRCWFGGGDELERFLGDNEQIVRHMDVVSARLVFLSLLLACPSEDDKFQSDSIRWLVDTDDDVACGAVVTA